MARHAEPQDEAETGGTTIAKAVAAYANEAAVSRAIKKTLKDLGYWCFSTTVVGFSRKGNKGTGIDAGLPDFLIAHTSWGSARCAIEVKGPKTALNKAQKEQNELGILPIARTPEDAVGIVAEFEERIGKLGMASRVAMQLGIGDDER